VRSIRLRTGQKARSLGKDKRYVYDRRDPVLARAAGCLPAMDGRRADRSDQKFGRRAADFEKELVENWARERWVWMHLLALAAIVLALALGW